MVSQLSAHQYPLIDVRNAGTTIAVATLLGSDARG